MKLIDLECANCGANDLTQAENGQLVCLFCGSSFGEAARLCPECGHYNEKGARHCSRCGRPTVRDCGACGMPNWVLADHCVRCGRNLDIIDQMVHRWQHSTQERLYERQQGAAALKAEEERASQERMAALMEEERARQEALALAQASRRQRDQQLYQISILVLFAFAIVVLLVVLLTSS